MNTLQKERELFKSKQSGWVTTYPNKFVLIKGDQVVGFFDSAQNAVAEGMRRFGSDSFLVRGVGETDEALKIPALMFGLFHASTALPS